jgi:peptidyl-prolyl cis-trans isomerase D
MLELIQQRFATVGLLLIVLALSAVFVLQFGGRQADGCTGSINQTGFAARVYGETITEGDFRAAYAVTNFNQYPTKQARTLRLRELTLDGLVERELLAHEAERLGFEMNAEEVMHDFVDSSVIYRNVPVEAPAGYPGPTLPPIDFEDDEGQFSSKNMRRYINNHLRRSSDEFAHWQVRERLAIRMREAVAAQATIAPEEILNQYVRDTDRAQLSYVTFQPAHYSSRVTPTDAEIDAWTEAHQSEVDEEFTRQRHRYVGLEPQTRARHILIKAAESAPEEDRTAARARAQALLTRAQAGEDFAALAREHSEDEGSAPQGGDLGWNVRGRMVAPFDTAQFETEAGQITDHLVETQFGFHIIKVEGHREGDVPEAEAKREIARGLLVAGRAGELARADADRALAYLREGHTPEELDERLLYDWQPAPAAPPPVINPDGTVTEATPPEPPERAASAPQVRETRSFGRTDTPISGAFDAGPLTRAAFSMTLDEPLPTEPLQLGTDWIVYQLTARTVATPEGLTEELREQIRSQLLEDKQEDAVRAFVRDLRERAIAAGQLRTDDRMLQYGDEPGEEGEDGEDEEEEEEAEEEESAIHRRLLDVPA